jgi:hypothetical protein
MQHIVRPVALDRIDDRDAGSVGGADDADVARLAAAFGVEDGTVEAHATLVGGDYACFAAPRIRVVAEDEFHGALSFRYTSQSGTGRFFDLRKAGLNSLL